MVGANLGIFLLAFKEEKGLGFRVQLWNQPAPDPVSYASNFRPQNECRPLRDDIQFLEFKRFWD